MSRRDGLPLRASPTSLRRSAAALAALAATLGAFAPGPCSATPIVSLNQPRILGYVIPPGATTRPIISGTYLGCSAITLSHMGRLLFTLNNYASYTLPAGTQISVYVDSNVHSKYTMFVTLSSPLLAGQVYQFDTDGLDVIYKCLGYTSYEPQRGG